MPYTKADILWVGNTSPCILNPQHSASLTNYNQGALVSIPVSPTVPLYSSAQLSMLPHSFPGVLVLTSGDP